MSPVALYFFTCFRAILSGEMDDVPEQAFFNVGTIDDVRKQAETL